MVSHLSHAGCKYCPPPPPSHLPLLNGSGIDTNPRDKHTHAHKNTHKGAPPPQPFVVSIGHDRHGRRPRRRRRRRRRRRCCHGRRPTPPPDASPAQPPGPAADGPAAGLSRPRRRQWAAIGDRSRQSYRGAWREKFCRCEPAGGWRRQWWGRAWYQCLRGEVEGGGESALAFGRAVLCGVHVGEAGGGEGRRGDRFLRRRRTRNKYLMEVQ